MALKRSAEFDAAVKFLIEEIEGNETVDTGGHTMYGISKKAYPNEDIANMTKARAEEIYLRDYWNALHLDDLPLPAVLKECIFSIGVNSGVGKAEALVRRAYNLVRTDADKIATPDGSGALWPMLKGFLKRKSTYANSFGGAFVTVWGMHYEKLVQDKTYHPYRRGWFARLYTTMRRGV